MVHNVFLSALESRLLQHLIPRILSIVSDNKLSDTFMNETKLET